MIATSMATGGVQSTVRELSDRLIDRGHTVGVVSLCLEDEVATRPEVERWSLGLQSLGRGRVFTAVSQVRAIARSFVPDVIHSHAIHSNIIASVVSRTERAPHVATMHSVHEGGPRLQFIWRTVRSPAARTVAVSSAVAVAHGLTEPAPVIRNVIDPTKFSFDRRLRLRTRQALGIPPESTVFITVGRLTAAKDLSTLVRAVAVWAGSDSCESAGSQNARAQRVLIAGGGNLFDSLASEISSAGLGTCVRMLGQRTDVRALLCAADVYVQSSSWEGYPLALLEARAAGLPIIATDVGGTRELDPPPEVLVQRSAPAQLAAAMAQASSLVRDQDQRALAMVGMGSTVMDRWVDAWVREYEAASQTC
jgi:glycosyltransferase involved in cell wall biosynthesis